MTDDNNTTASLDQTDEEILTTTVSDETLEAAAGAERDGLVSTFAHAPTFPGCC